MSANINGMMEKAVQEQLGSLTMEVVKLRVIVQAHVAEIARLKGALEAATAKEPELPLPMKEARNGAAPH